MISRPHTDVDISELIGQPILSILAVPGATAHSLTYFYIGYDNTYLRIFIDAGLLFVDPCNGPDKTEDLEPDQEYLDFTLMYKLASQTITKAAMKNGVFRLLFQSGTELRFKENDSEITFRAVYPPVEKHTNSSS